MFTEGSPNARATKSVLVLNVKETGDKESDAANFRVEVF